MKRYVQVTVKPHRIKRYPLRAKKIVFTLPRSDAVQAVEMMMAYIGYGSSQYNIIDSVEVGKI